MFKLVKQLVHPAQVPFVRRDNARVLLFSMRRIQDLVAACAIYEFEDVCQKLVAADQIEPQTLEVQNFLRRIYKVGRVVAGSALLASKLTPRIHEIRLDHDYDLFLPVFNHAHEVFALDAVAGWRKRCRYAACYISEMWEGQLPEYLLERLAQFDCIFLGVTQPVQSVARITGLPCSYLPLGVDGFLFAPPANGQRPIHVCGIGRRSEVTHQALLALARERGLFYYYDTVRTRGIPNAARQITFSVSSPVEHRFLYSSLLKNSRYMMASRARANEPDVTGGRQEIAGRFFEGAAAGAVMIGEPPRNDLFDSYFDWPDAVIRAPFDDPDIARVIAALDADPERIARIRKDSVVSSLRKSDWVYRLQTVFAAAGLEPTAAMTDRIRNLRAMADALASPGVVAA